MQLLYHLLFVSWVFVCLASTKPNIVLILTDDQDIVLNSMNAMKNVKTLIGNKGVTFKNAFVNTPICCPSRSTILTGKYLHNTHVRNNSLSGNCSSSDWQRNHEPFSIAARLKKVNYINFYAGKYLNEYGNTKCGGTKHVPQGYDWWIGLKGNSKYYNYVLSINGTAKKFTNKYLTDIMKNYALSFLNQNSVKQKPFFMMLSTPAAHAPFTPAPRHRKKFPGMKAFRTPSFNFSSTDKHWLIRMPPKYLPLNVTILDNIQRNRLQTLLAVDELVKEIVRKLRSLKLLKSTYIIFTSDNGFHIGQFVQPWDKRQPYETDIRVPFLIRGPKLKINYTTNIPISAVDIAPTLLDIAGAPHNDMDGKSFLKSIFKKSLDTYTQEKNILIEYFGEGAQNWVDESCPWTYDINVTECTKNAWCKCQDSRNNTYSCIRRFTKTSDVKFCTFSDHENFVEFYDLEKDPYELKNLYFQQSNEVGYYKAILKKLQKCKGTRCNL